MKAQLMTRILFATDFSDCAARAEEYATALAMAWDANLDVLHVLEGSAWMLTSAAGFSSAEQFHKGVSPQLDEIQKQIALKGVAATVHQRRGIPSEEINLATKEYGIDLIVLGAHGNTRLDPVLLGKTTEQVTKTAPCPVLTVPDVRGGALLIPMTVQSPVSVQHILAPIDFSSASVASLEYAIQFAKRRGATLTLLHVLEPVYHDLELGLGQIEHESVKRTHSEAYLAELAIVARSRGLSADFVVCGGIPSDSILACALYRQCDLIVMGSHWRRGMSRGHLGSVTEAVLGQATCPVLTVRSPKFRSGRHPISEIATAMRRKEHRSWKRVTYTSPSSTVPV